MRWVKVPREVEAARLDEWHECGPGPRHRCEDCAHGEALQEDQSHREGELHGEVHTHDRDGAAGGDTREGVEHGRIGPDGLDHRVGTPATGGLEHLGRSRCDAGIDRFGPQRLGPGQPLGDHVHRQDPGGAEERGALQRHDADGAQPHDDHRRAGPDGGPQRAEVAGGEDVGRAARPRRRPRLRGWGGRRRPRTGRPSPPPARRGGRASCRTRRTCRRGRHWVGRPGRGRRRRSRSRPRPTHGRPP